ncbi:MAG: hypothetical protein LBD12_04870, partial [Clostridiales Family XIII bacterium]|nr:hypothetical protein [Clostridiales Family XIII bacterium]
EDAGKHLYGVDILLNATPMGMAGIDAQFRSFGFLDALPKHALVYDLIYEPSETNLLKAARQKGLATENGLSMLVGQGILSEELFLGHSLDRQLGAALLAALSKEADGRRAR